MIGNITCRLRTLLAKRNLGRKVFDIQDINARVYRRKRGNVDTLTVLDKNYNRLFVENRVVKNDKEQEIATFFYNQNGKPSFSIISQQKITN